MKILKLFALIPLILAAALQAAPEVGKKAPDFTLTDLEGQEHSLSDFEGKYVVLEWMNPGCPFVQKFYQQDKTPKGELPRLQKEMTQDDVVWLTINSTNPDHRDYRDPEAMKKLAKEWNVQSTAYMLDEDGEVGKKYDAKTTPHMYVIDPQGTLIYQGAIDSNRSADPADIPDATNYVVVALEEAKAGKEVSTKTTRPYGCSVKY